MIFKKILISMFTIFIFNISTLYIKEAIVLVNDGELLSNTSEIYYY